MGRDQRPAVPLPPRPSPERCAAPSVSCAVCTNAVQRPQQRPRPWHTVSACAGDRGQFRTPVWPPRCDLYAAHYPRRPRPVEGRGGQGTRSGQVPTSNKPCNRATVTVATTCGYLYFDFLFYNFTSLASGHVIFVTAHTRHIPSSYLQFVYLRFSYRLPQVR